MKLEIRKAKPEEMDDFRSVARTALMLPTAEELSHDLTLCAFKDGKLATSYAAWPLTVRVNGGDIPVAGVTMVGTLPVYRRLGCLRQITSKHFETLREQGERPIAALYASRAAIYQRYGYVIVVTSKSYTIEPRYLEFADGQTATGNFREASDDDMNLLYRLYDRFIEERSGYLRRSRDMWKWHIRPPSREGSQLNRIVYEEAGKPQGYVIYTADLIHEGRHRWNQNIAISDLVWFKPTAYRAIWDFFSRMDVIIDIKWGQAPVDDPLPHLLLEPRMLNTALHDGMLARIVDIEGALAKRGYDEEGKLTFKVIDKLCPWNQGTWKLETSPGGAMIRHTDEEPQLEMPVSTLAMLYFGQVSATEAARMGRLDVLEAGSLTTWDKVMGTRYQPCCADMF